ncbi:MAG: hypothetical protein KZQ75_04315 [Candidatus Thiodiazotropha sp. (ex Myrtea spinifera)]|nr:hypothetical protein [Candidatus Thiodiazotropha sp. (ex Myrtea spinifera)]
MKYNYSLIPFFILLTFMMHGCVATKSQLVKIENGERPSVGFIVSVPDEIQVEYLGFTVFNNKYRIYPSPSDTQQTIERQIDTILSASKKVNLVNAPKPDVDKLRKSVSREPNRDRKHKLTESDISRISKWGKSHKLDYVALFFANVSDNITYGRPGSPTGKGVLADVRTFLYAAYKVVLIDTEAAEVTDASTTRSFKRVPRFGGSLTQKDIDRVTKDWEYGKNNDGLDKEPEEALREMLAIASYYDGDDFTSLKDEHILKIDNDLTSIISRNILVHLIDLGFVEGKKITSLFDRIKPDKEITYVPYILE